VTVPVNEPNRSCAKLGEVIAENLDRQLRAHTGQHFIHALRDRLVHHDLHARQY